MSGEARFRHAGARWGAVLALSAAALIVFAWKVSIVAPIQFVGHGDAAAYATMAESLRHGRGLEVDYVSWYFRKYPPGITRPEDHWPPFYAALIVPFAALLGKTAFAAKLPSLLVSALAWPATTAALARRVSRSDAVALASGLTILLFTPIFVQSLHALADVTYGWLVTLAVLCAIKGYDDSRWFPAMGAALACAWYTKGSTIVLLPALVGYHLAWRTWVAAPTERGTRDRGFLAGLGVCLLVMTPWFVRNAIQFGNPLYSTHTHAAGYMGWQGWEQATYALYWGERPAPSPLDKLRQPALLARKATEFLARYAWWLTAQWGGDPVHFRATNFSTYLIGVPALAGFVLAAGAAVRRLAGRAAALGRSRFLQPEHALLALVIGVQIAFLALFWEPNDRLLLPVWPLVVVMGWATWFAVVERASSRAVAAAVVLLLAGVWSMHEVGYLRAVRTFGGYPWTDGGVEWIDAGRWLRANAPEAIVMTRQPWELHYYSDTKTIQIPLAPLARIIEVADYHHATHLIPDVTRPMLQPWVAGTIPGLERVYEGNGLTIYAIHYEALPAELAPPGRRPG